MTEREFSFKMAQAKSRSSQSPCPGYYEGYVKGLHRFYYGPSYGTLQDHEEWLSRAYRGTDQGRGYQDGLQGIRPKF
jgi:hypothetical protein